MPQDKLSMRKIRDVLRYRHSTGLSLEAIARALNISKGVVAKYLRLATAAGLGWPLPEDLDDTARCSNASPCDTCGRTAGDTALHSLLDHPTLATGRDLASCGAENGPIVTADSAAS